MFFKILCYYYLTTTTKDGAGEGERGQGLETTQTLLEPRPPGTFFNLLYILC